MNRKLILGIVGSVVALFLAIAFVSSQNYTESPTKVANSSTLAAKSTKAKLEVFKAGVSVSKDGQTWEAVNNSTEVSEGEKVKTDATGRAQLVYINNSVTRIDFNSEITLSTIDSESFGAKITLESGRIWSRIAKLLGQETYETGTTTTVAAIRGTSYGHEATDSTGDKIVATKGEIKESCLNGSQSETIPHGFWGLFDCKPGTKPKIGEITNDLKDEWFKFNEAEDKKLNDKFGKDKYGDEEEVLGLTTEATPTARPTLAPPVLIDCVLPDGKTTKQTQKDCDFVNEFWKSHPPASVQSSGDSGPQSTPEPTPTPAPILPTLDLVEELFCDCGGTNLTITGTLFTPPTGVSASVDDGNGGTITTNAINATLVSETQIHAVFDKFLAPGIYAVQVTLEDGTVLTGQLTIPIRGQEIPTEIAA